MIAGAGKRKRGAGAFCGARLATSSWWPRGAEGDPGWLARSARVPRQKAPAAASSRAAGQPASAHMRMPLPFRARRPARIPSSAVVPRGSGRARRPMPATLAFPARGQSICLDTHCQVGTAGWRGSR